MNNKSCFLPTTLLILIIAFLMTGCAKSAGPTSQLTNFQINVIGAVGNPLSGAKVVSQSQPAGQLTISGLSDVAGKVVFNGIRTGDYTLSVSRFDYNQVEVAVTITPSTGSLTVKMTPAITPVLTPTASPISVTFSQLINQPQTYNGLFVTLECFYFSGFEISALTTELVPSTYTPANISPGQPLIWVTGNLGQDVYNNMLKQSNTPSGYPESFGRVRVTGQFQYGAAYGHLDSYKYQLTATGAVLLPWSIPAR